MLRENQIILKLSYHQVVFQSLLADLSRAETLWKENPDKWCLLEIICHLLDEEREDFRARVDAVLQNQKPQPFDPLAWVTERNYMDQDYPQKLQAFLNERLNSVKWLQSLKEPAWEKTFNHPKMGPLSAGFFLTNWLAHDYLHIRQIVRIKFNYLHQETGVKLNYAGEW